jgi:hypothetical protein
LLRFNNIFIRPGNVKYCENVFSDTVWQYQKFFLSYNDAYL